MMTILCSGEGRDDELKQAYAVGDKVEICKPGSSLGPSITRPVQRFGMVGTAECCTSICASGLT